jgi:hypothetical protein
MPVKAAGQGCRTSVPDKTACNGANCNMSPQEEEQQQEQQQSKT